MPDLINKLSSYAALIGVVGAIGGGFYAWGEFNTRLSAIEGQEFVVNQIVAKEMVANQPDMSSYFNMNAALFDTRQLPSGDPAFFMQVSLDSYNKTIYNTQANLVATDPVVQYQIKLNKAQQATDAAYIKLKGLMDARLN